MNYVCVIMLKRIGEAEHKYIERQHLNRVPKYGETMELRVDGEAVLAVVAATYHPSGSIAGEFAIRLDELPAKVAQAPA